MMTTLLNMNMYRSKSKRLGFLLIISFFSDIFSKDKATAGYYGEKQQQTNTNNNK